MNTLRTVEEFRASIAAERAADRKAAASMVEACKSGDVELFFEAVDLLHNYSVDGWRLAFKGVSKLDEVSPVIRSAFFEVWVESKSIANSVFDDFLTIAALQVLLPPYSGPARKLYRGEFLRNRSRRTYGLSWTADLAIAERFATDARQMSEGGSVLLETLAPASAIIATTHDVGDHYNESEFLVDRRLLSDVKVIRRFPQLDEFGLKAKK